MPEIIFVTDLPLWSLGKASGGPAFSKTVGKYIDEGWEVFLLSDVPSNTDYPRLDSRHNLVLRPTAAKRLIGVKKLGLAARWLDHRLMTRRFCRAAEKIIGRKRHGIVLYAYEVFGVLACERLSHKFKLPVVTRFQGTILSAYSDSRYNRISRYPHYQALSAKADLVVMTDDGTQGDRVLRELHNDSKRILFLRNGLDLMEKDLASFKASLDRNAFRRALNLSENDVMFLTVSRLTGWKKVDRAIDAFADCRTRASNVRLVIVGDGDCRQALEQRARDLGAADRVTFTSSVPHEEVYRYMNACDIFVSLYDLSNVGNPLLEAMTLGKCIVTLDSGDTGKLIEDRRNGILMSYGALPQLGAVFAELAGNPALRDSLGNAAAAYAQKSFRSWKERMDCEFDAVHELPDSFD